MESGYWKSRWRHNKIGWHMDAVYPHLKTFWPQLNLEPGALVLAPLCGKSPDLLWLAERGYHVIGVEVSPIAVYEFFDDSNLSYKEYRVGPFTVLRSERIQLWFGDFFKLKKSHITTPSAVYDKASLIALPREKRTEYADLTLELCSTSAPMLLNTFEYNREEMSGPPFAVFEEELDRLYGDHFSIQLLHEESIFERMKKFRERGLQSYLLEKIYHLKPRN